MQKRAMFKNMKLPMFNGEKPDHNKVAIHTVLHKGASRCLCRTLATIMATKASPTLEGKAKNWWMSLPAGRQTLAERLV